MNTKLGTEIMFWEIPTAELGHIQPEWLVPDTFLAGSWEISEKQAIELANHAEALFRSMSNNAYWVIVQYRTDGDTNDPPRWEASRHVCVISNEPVPDGGLAAVYASEPKYRPKHSNKKMPELMTWHYHNPKPPERSSGFAGMSRFDRFDRDELLSMHDNCANNRLREEMMESLNRRARGSDRSCGSSKYPCPVCGVPSVAVVYGYLAGGKDAKVRARGDIAGGCCSSDATRYCYNCDKKFVP